MYISVQYKLWCYIKDAQHSSRFIEKGFNKTKTVLNTIGVTVVFICSRLLYKYLIVQKANFSTQRQ